MMFPWKRWEAAARRRLAEAERRSEVAEQLIEQTRITTARYDQVTQKNGWTELFARAMEAR
ncbi:hypothetical protein QEH38_gp35 [Mycobacterium phage LilSpotty]|uniref:Uncharacterized protein n=1 Tax=Mycobacterium phage LilSpotty TaxID=2588512 RepID=A0A4Y6ENY4_9CAUD|nr:hypothetical protein QEH38_gp35 [Mycobacterium phage LilSpotty]QDF19767.1 hypothetical protein SEA_LILSPOTTY_35 [Mycobacterium phage LilSpotty]